MGQTGSSTTTTRRYPSSKITTDSNI